MQSHLFILKIDKILKDRNSMLQKKVFYSYAMNVIFSYLSPDTFYLKRTKYTSRCSVKNSTIYKEQFILYMQFLFLRKSKIEREKFSRMKNSTRTKASFFRISSFYHLIRLLFKKQNMAKDAAWKALQFVNNRFILIVSFLFWK